MPGLHSLLSVFSQMPYFMSQVTAVPCPSRFKFFSVSLLLLPWLSQLLKNPPAMQVTWVQSLGWEDSPGEGNGYPLQDSGLENSVDCTVHGVAKSQT